MQGPAFPQSAVLRFSPVPADLGSHAPSPPPSGDSDDICWAIPALSGGALDALKGVVRANGAVDVHNARDDAANL